MTDITSLPSSMDQSAMDQPHDSSSDTPNLSSGVTEEEPKPTTVSDEEIPAPLESPAERVSSKVAEKAGAIRRACDLRDFDALASYAASEGGLLQDELRQLAWPILLRCDQNHDLADWNDRPKHQDEGQIQLDVDRSFVYYPRGQGPRNIKKQAALLNHGFQVLRKYPMLCYFQGYHDIAQVLLLVLGEEQAAEAVAQISLFRIRDYMLPSLAPALKHLQLIPAIIERADPKLRQHISGIRPFFALASTLTLYAHDIEEYSDIARLFDFLLAHEPAVSIYLFAAIILSRKKQLLEIPLDDPDMLHFTLSKLPYPLNLDGLISHALELFKDYPPESLSFGVWKQISPYSVLKTSREPFQEHTAEEAVKLFQKQTRQLRNEELREKALTLTWKHRRAIGSGAVAILIAAVSFWIRREGFDAPIWSYLSRFNEAILGHDYFSG